MSGIYKKLTGYEIRFQGVRGRTEMVYLPRTSKREAESLLTKIESVCARKNMGLQPLPEDIQFISSIGEKLYKKLQDRQIVEAKVEKAESPTLIGWVDGYMANHAGSEGTLKQFRTVRKDLATFFGEDAKLDGITEGDAHNFQSWLRRRGLADATVRKRCSRTKQFFRAAIRSEIITKSPFDNMATHAVENEARMIYISNDRVMNLLDSIECQHLRTVLALCRFGGLRRHETALIAWDDIDFRKGSVVVRSNKTPARRVCPLFPELRDYLKPIKRSSGFVQTRFEADSNAPATALAKHCRRNGIDLWIKPYQNLRASKITDLLGRFPVVDVCKWLGNSPTVAHRHYAIARSENFKAAQE